MNAKKVAIAMGLGVLGVIVYNMIQKQFPKLPAISQQ